MIDRSEADIMSTWITEDKTTPMVSVRCMVYNHVKYIEKALDGFLKQETTFPFEVIIHDDCSTDGSTQLIKIYEERYPNIIRAFYEEENQFSKVNGARRVVKMLQNAYRGKYIAFCDGDDYWNAYDKLQKQFEALESNPTISVCVCRTHIEYEDGENSDREEFIPPHSFDVNSSRIINSDELAELIFGDVAYPFHTSGFFYKKEFEIYGGLEALGKFTEGDEIKLRQAIIFGGVYFINEVMSCYRWLAKESWTADYFSKTEEEKYVHARNQAKANTIFDEITEGRFHSLIQKRNFSILRRWLFIVNTRMVIKDMSMIVGNDVTKTVGMKGKFIYWLAQYAPHLGKCLYRWYSKLGG